jgi:hypothetical protein
VEEAFQAESRKRGKRAREQKRITSKSASTHRRARMRMRRGAQAKAKKTQPSNTHLGRGERKSFFWPVVRRNRATNLRELAYSFWEHPMVVWVAKLHVVSFEIPDE